MSTTVSYKGNTIATINHGNSATLTTQGTWVEGNITVSAGALNLQSKTINPTTSQQTITADNGYDGLSSVSIGAVKYHTATISGTGMVVDLYVQYDSAKYYQDNDSFAFNANETIYLYCTGRFNGGSIYIDGVQVAANQTNSVTYTYTLPNGNIEITLAYGSSGQINITTEAASNTPTLQSKTVTPTELQQSVSADSGYDGLSTVTVEAIPAGNKGMPNVTRTISGNSHRTLITYPNASGYFTKEDLGSDSYLTGETKTVTPSETAQTVGPTSASYYLNSVTVEAISSNYIGSAITQRSSSDLTASGATVIVPAGYYASQATKSVSTTTHPNPTVSVNSSTGLITASHTQTAGYVSAGTTTGTSQLSTQAATTITPTTSSQVAVAAGKYTLGAVTVAAIPSNYVDASSLKTYYTGSSAPSSSLGANGDLYFQTSEV